MTTHLWLLSIIGLLQQFFVQATSGGQRPVISLSSINNFVHRTSFKMETVYLVLDSIRKGDVIFSIGLKNAYFQILIQPDSWPCLWIALNSSLLVQGLSTAPQVVPKVFSLALEWANKRGMCLLLEPLVDHSRVGSSPSGTMGAPTLSLTSPRDCHQLGKIRPRADK